MGANYSGLIKVIFLCVFAAQPSSILLAQMIDREDRVLFQNARIVIGDGGIIENGSLFIENGTITEVSSQTFAAQAGTIVVDASGKTIFPALFENKGALQNKYFIKYYNIISHLNNHLKLFFILILKVCVAILQMFQIPVCLGLE